MTGAGRPGGEVGAARASGTTDASHTSHTSHTRRIAWPGRVTGLSSSAVREKLDACSPVQYLAICSGKLGRRRRMTVRPAAANDDGKEPLTERQQKVLDFIARSIDERGYPPTLREIGEHMGIRSTNGVNDHLKALEKKGYLEREDLKSRALRPLDFEMPQGSHSSHMVDVPLLGKVAAGMPILAVEQAEETVRV